MLVAPLVLAPLLIALLAYVPKRAPGARPDRWRKVEVKMTPSSLSARTISGYYP